MRVLCKEQVFEVCPEGHISSRRCSQAKQPCPVCVELQELREREKLELKRKVGKEYGFVFWSSCSFKCLCVVTRETTDF